LKGGPIWEVGIETLSRREVLCFWKGADIGGKGGGGFEERRPQEEEFFLRREKGPFGRHVERTMPT